MRAIAVLLGMVMMQATVQAQELVVTEMHENNAVITEAENTPELRSEVYESQNAYIERIFPNPANNHTYIIMEWGMDENIAVAVELYDLTGKRVYAERHTLVNGDNMIKVDTSVLPEGVYFLGVKDHEGYHELIDYMSKLIVAR